MPVIQIDKNGFIKGTNRKFTMKVIVTKAMMIKGEYVPVNTVLDLEGAFLAECIAYHKVEKYQEPVKELTDAEVAEKIANMEVDEVKVQDQVQDDNKKPGPKKNKKK